VVATGYSGTTILSYLQAAKNEIAQEKQILHSNIHLVPKIHPGPVPAKKASTIAAPPGPGFIR
jgi:hypothetical protein